jgi:hypothetical protein
MREQDLVIAFVAAVVVLALLFLFLARGRRQRVSFGDTQPLARSAPERGGPAPAATPLPQTDDLSAGLGLGPSGDGAPAVSTGSDALTRIKGLGPKAAAQLATLGITRFDQIAAWDEAEAASMDARMGAFRGRIARDRWIEQAKLLAADDTAAFEAQFGKLGG